MVTPDFQHTPAGFEALTATMWRERDLLDALLFALSAQLRLVEAGDTRWLGHATAQVSDRVDELRGVEVERAMIADELFAECGLHDSSSMLDLADAAGEPTASIHRDLHAATSVLTLEIDRAVRRIDALLFRLAGSRTEPRSGASRS